MQKATGSYRTYSSLVKLQPNYVPEFAMEDLPSGRIAAFGACVCSEGPALGQNTDDDYDDIEINV